MWPTQGVQVGMKEWMKQPLLTLEVWGSNPVLLKIPLLYHEAKWVLGGRRWRNITQFSMGVFGIRCLISYSVLLLGRRHKIKRHKNQRRVETSQMMAALEAAFQTNTPTIINSYPTQLLVEPRPIFLHQPKGDVLRNILHESAGTREYDIFKTIYIIDTEILSKFLIWTKIKI